MNDDAYELVTDPSVPLPGVQDPARLEALRSTGLLDSDAEESFDRFTSLAKLALGIPVALVSLVDHDRQFFKSSIGLGEPWASKRQTPLTHSFCQRVVSTKAPLVISDATRDPRVMNNLAVSELGVTSYAGMPLTTSDGHCLGAFCVVSSEQHEWTTEELATLEKLAAAVMTEIELRRTVRQLTAQRAISDAVFVHGGLGMVVTSPTSDIRRANKALATMLGYRADELVGVNVAALEHPDDRARYMPRYEALAYGDVDRVQIETRYRMRSGTFLWAKTTLSTARDEHGRLQFYVATVEDIEEARRTKEALRVSEDRYRTLVRQLPNTAVMLFDTDLRVLLADGEELFHRLGTSVKHARGKKLHELAAPQNQEVLEQQYRATLAGNKTTVELSRNGYDLVVHTTPVYDESGRVTCGMVTTHDITLHKKAEREIRKQAEAMKLLEDVATAANQAHSASEAFARVLELVARHVGFCIGHAFLREGDDLVASDLWWLADPEAARPFVLATGGLRYRRGQALAEVIDTRQPKWMVDISENRGAYPRWAAAAQLGLGSALGFPVLVGDEVVAVLTFNHVERFAPDAALLALMQSVGTQLGRVVERERYAAEVRALSSRDELTGLLNRRGFMEHAEARRDAALSRSERFTVLFVDLNWMKPINDMLGHEAGDSALRDTGDLLRAAFHGGDLVARLGGDEFVVITEALADEDAGRLELRIRDAVAAFNAASTRAYRLSLSIGTSVFDPADPRPLGTLLAEADGGMYEQKRARRASGAASLAPLRSTSYSSLRINLG